MKLFRHQSYTEALSKARPFLIASAVYAGVTAAILIASYHIASDHFIYALDDTYINMAMAKNVAAHGVWGVSPFEFSSSTSTPLFTLLLSSLYWVTGPIQYGPLVLSWAFGLGSIYVAWTICAEYLPEKGQIVALIAIILLSPFFVIGTLGMEHSLHLLLTLLFMRLLVADAILPLAVITCLMTATRYEGLFMASVGFLILAILKRWVDALVVAFSATLPVCAYALFSIAHHGYWLPNSVSLKCITMHGRMINILSTAILNSFWGAHLLFLVIALSIMVFSVRKLNPKLARMACLVAGAGWLHLVTANVGWAFRYEAYLIACGIVVIACALPQLGSYLPIARKSVVFFLILAGALLIRRSIVAAISIPLYSKSIYAQQWQMANFVNTYYPGASVALNDIGAVNFKTDIHCLDLVGLASSDVFWAKRNRTYSTDFLDSESHLRVIEVAIIYDSWFSAHPRTRLGGPPIPASWIRVRRWRTPKLGEGDDTVSFYALNPSEAGRLQAHLNEFEKSLPDGVAELP
jgi:hypothetical protein